MFFHMGGGGIVVISLARYDVNSNGITMQSATSYTVFHHVSAKAGR